MHIHAHGTGIHRAAAFTVLELLVTLAVAAILLLTAVPSFQQYTQRQNMKAAVNSLHNGLLLARNEAVHRNVPVVACPGDDTDGCTVPRSERRPPAPGRRNVAAARTGVGKPVRQQFPRPHQHPVRR
jgi:Tfp pilus assembly protein FimT